MCPPDIWTDSFDLFPQRSDMFEVCPGVPAPVIISFTINCVCANLLLVEENDLVVAEFI